MKQWELIEAVPIECTMDNSGIYTVINRVKSNKTHKQYADTTVLIRCDIILSSIQPGNLRVPQTDIPLVSFIGRENDVRKHVIQWIGLEGINLSAEHASYIGYELMRAKHDFNYTQD